MKIADDWHMSDGVTGLHFKVIPCREGRLNRLRVFWKEGIRDFWFTASGEFDGTGSICERTPTEE